MLVNTLERHIDPAFLIYYSRLYFPLNVVAIFNSFSESLGSIEEILCRDNLNFKDKNWSPNIKSYQMICETM